MAAMASAVRVTVVPPIVKERPLLKPSPQTKMTPAMIRFLDLVRSTLFSTTLRTPMAEIIPYSMKLTPPMIEDGMVLMSADTFGMKLTIIAKTAAIRMTLGSCTRLNSRTPVFSPYVVLAGPPMKPAIAVARPSPSRVLCRPGSERKFSPTVAEIADISPTCSIMVAIAIGAMIIMLVRSNLQSCSGGSPTMPACATGTKLMITDPSGFLMPSAFRTTATA